MSTKSFAFLFTAITVWYCTEQMVASEVQFFLVERKTIFCGEMATTYADLQVFLSMQVDFLQKLIVF